MSRRSRRKPSSLKRRTHVAEPKRRFFVYCEGTETEPAYFHHLRECFENAQVEPIGVGGVARTVAHQAVDRAKDLRLQRRRRGTRTPSYEESDQVWAVFDQDGHPNIDEVLTMCRDNRVAVARSNPCFELWLILHFENYDKPATPRDVQTHLHVLCPEYHHDDCPSPSFARLMTGLDAAEERAARQLHLRDREQDPEGNPSSTMGNLTQAIRVAHEESKRR